MTLSLGTALLVGVTYGAIEFLLDNDMVADLFPDM